MDDEARVDRVRVALADLGYQGEIMVTPASTHSAQDAAVAAGCELGQIVKTLVVYVTGAAHLALVAGDRRLDDRLMAAHAGTGRKQIKLADTGQVQDLTGYPVGGVSPFGLPAPLPVIADLSLRRFSLVWVAAGTPNAILPIALDDLARYVDAVFADIAS